jgi:cytochrome c oxidase subunit 3
MYKNNQVHPFHLVDPSPWPILASGSVSTLLGGSVLYFYGVIYSVFFVRLSFILTASLMAIWWRDVVREASYEGQHTYFVERSMRMGMVLFILSEIMFFFAFFWAFFYSSIDATVEVGSIWPPEGLEVPHFLSIPLLNTLILLLSGATITISHKRTVMGHRKMSLDYLFITFYLGIFFLFLQYFEYSISSFSISDSVYGCCFYMATGFHGLHVFVGASFILASLYRMSLYHFTRDGHFGYEACIWYWHFVDVVWVFLYFFVYWWGGR